MALFKRNLDFKTLFGARLAGLFIPLLISIPIAIIYKNYCALILSNVALKFATALYLTIKSEWKPIFYFNFIVF